MSRARALCLWTLLMQAGPATSDKSGPEFFVREEGESVVLSCHMEPQKLLPIGVYLRRSWVSPGEVLFKYTKSEVSVQNLDFINRTSVSGDPGDHAVNVTLSGLRPTDTDRYHCEFNLDNPGSQDTVQRGRSDFVLLVIGASDVERDWEQACVASSVVLPCVPPVGDSSAVEGAVLKRQRGQQPVEILYHSKHSSQSSQSSVDRFQLSTAPGPGGISYSLTVGALQPEDSGLYSCQLLLKGRPHSRSMGRQGRYVLVQAPFGSGCVTLGFALLFVLHLLFRAETRPSDRCGCSAYTALIYALSAAVAVCLALLVVVVLMHRSKGRRATAAPAPAPIYEEMTGLKSKKNARQQADEGQTEHRNVSLKRLCPENHYESPNGALSS